VREFSAEQEDLSCVIDPHEQDDQSARCVYRILDSAVLMMKAAEKRS
jgi:hypothetical protein